MTDTRLLFCLFTGLLFGTDAQEKLGRAMLHDDDVSTCKPVESYAMTGCGNGTWSLVCRYPTVTKMLKGAPWQIRWFRSDDSHAQESAAKLVFEYTRERPHKAHYDLESRVSNVSISDDSLTVKISTLLAQDKTLWMCHVLPKENTPHEYYGPVNISRHCGSVSKYSSVTGKNQAVQQGCTSDKKWFNGASFGIGFACCLGPILLAIGLLSLYRRCTRPRHDERTEVDGHPSERVQLNEDM